MIPWYWLPIAMGTSFLAGIVGTLALLRYLLFERGESERAKTK